MKSGDTQCSPGEPSIKVLQENTWKIKAPTKLQHFIWQSLTGCVAVNGKLRERGLNCDPSCPRCSEEVETVNHALFECPPAMQTWLLLGIPLIPDQFPTTSIYSNLDFLLNIGTHDTPNLELFDMFPWIIWYIWKSRNDKLFKNTERQPAEILKTVRAEFTAWMMAQETKNGPPPPVTREGVMASEISQGSSVCRTDGSWSSSKTFAGLGWSFTPNGRLLPLYGAKSITRPASPLHTELEGIIWAMEALILQDIKEVHVQTDSLEAIQILSQTDPWPNFKPYLASFASLKARFERFSLSKIPRTRNESANLLARFACNLDFSFCHVDSVVPLGLQGNIIS